MKIMNYVLVVKEKKMARETKDRKLWRFVFTYVLREKETKRARKR